LTQWAREREAGVEGARAHRSHEILSDVPEASKICSILLSISQKLAYCRLAFFTVADATPSLPGLSEEIHLAHVPLTCKNRAAQRQDPTHRTPVPAESCTISLCIPQQLRHRRSPR
jgi:hypothetical protein